MLRLVPGLLQTPQPAAAPRAAPSAEDVPLGSGLPGDLAVPGGPCFWSSLHLWPWPAQVPGVLRSFLGVFRTPCCRCCCHLPGEGSQDR